MNSELLTMDTSKVNKKIEKLVKNMGGSFFWDFLDFIIDIKKSVYDIKILKARKFYVLYHVFDDVIDRLYNKSVITVGKVVSHTVLPAIKCELQDAKILLIDDVLLHGRAIEDVYRYLVDYCHCDEKNIDLKVYLRNEDKKLVFKKNIVSKQNVHDQSWSWMSCSFVDAFFITGMPYISILPCFKISAGKKESKNNIDKIIKDSIPATTDVQKYNGQKLWIYTMPYNNTQYVEQAFIRIYKCADEAEYSIVPYMFLKPMSKENIVSLVTNLLDYKVLKFLSPNFFKDGFDSLDEKDYTYLYNILLYTGSKAIGLEMINSLGGHKGAKLDNFVEKDGIYCEVNIKKDMIPLIRGIFTNTTVENEIYPKKMDEPDIDEIIEKASAKNSQSIQHFLDMYLLYNGKKDKELADAGQDRMNGLRFPKLMEHLGYKNNKKDFWREVVNAIDLGKGTIIASKSPSGFYESLLFAGEQCFTCCEEYKIAVGFPLVSFRNYIDKIDTDVICDTKKQELYNQLLSDIYQNKKIKDNMTDEELNSLVKEDSLEKYKNYYLSRYPVYENNPIMKEILSIVFKYEEKILLTAD